MKLLEAYKRRNFGSPNGYSADPEIRMRSNGDLAWNQALQAKMGYPERVIVRAGNNGSVYTMGLAPAKNTTADSMKVSMEGGHGERRGKICSCSCENYVKKQAKKYGFAVKARMEVNPLEEDGYFWVRMVNGGQ